MDLVNIATALSISSMLISFLVAQPNKERQETMMLMLQEIKSNVEMMRRDNSEINSKLAVNSRDINTMWERIDKLEDAVRDLKERGCCHADQD